MINELIKRGNQYSIFHVEEWALGVLRMEYYDMNCNHLLMGEALKYWNPIGKRYDVVYLPVPSNTRFVSNSAYIVGGEYELYLL